MIHYKKDQKLDTVVLLKNNHRIFKNKNKSSQLLLAGIQ